MAITECAYGPKPLPYQAPAETYQHIELGVQFFKDVFGSVLKRYSEDDPRLQLIMSEQYLAGFCMFLDQEHVKQKIIDLPLAASSVIDYFAVTTKINDELFDLSRYDHVLDYSNELLLDSRE